MAVLVRFCCCGCKLNTGILLIAWFCLVSKSEYPCQYIIKSCIGVSVPNQVRLLRSKLALAWGCGSLYALQKYRLYFGGSLESDVIFTKINFSL